VGKGSNKGRKGTERERGVKEEESWGDLPHDLGDRSPPPMPRICVVYAGASLSIVVSALSSASGAVSFLSISFDYAP